MFRPVFILQTNFLLLMEKNNVVATTFRLKAHSSSWKWNKIKEHSLKCESTTAPNTVILTSNKSSEESSNLKEIKVSINGVNEEIKISSTINSSDNQNKICEERIKILMENLSEKNLTRATRSK